MTQSSHPQVYCHASSLQGRGTARQNESHFSDRTVLLSQKLVWVGVRIRFMVGIALRWPKPQYCRPTDLQVTVHLSPRANSSAIRTPLIAIRTSKNPLYACGAFLANKTSASERCAYDVMIYGRVAGGLITDHLLTGCQLNISQRNLPAEFPFIAFNQTKWLQQSVFRT